MIGAGIATVATGLTPPVPGAGGIELICSGWMELMGAFATPKPVEPPPEDLQNVNPDETLKLTEEVVVFGIFLVCATAFSIALMFTSFELLGLMTFSVMAYFVFNRYSLFKESRRLLPN